MNIRIYIIVYLPYIGNHPQMKTSRILQICKTFVAENIQGGCDGLLNRESFLVNINSAEGRIRTRVIPNILK